ncbi:MAG: rRNA maturation RNase YbeY [bacterium]
MRGIRSNIEINNKAGYDIDLNSVRKIVEAFCRVYKINKNKNISIAFVSGAEMRKLNSVYRGIDKTTDVLSFEGQGDFLGEIVIDCGQIKQQAVDFNNSAEDELIFILAHGLLHLIGYDDKTEKARLEMIRQGEKFIKKLKKL